MYDGRYPCPDRPTEPPEQEEISYFCPVCGEELWDENWIYLYQGQVLGCESCVERCHPYEGLEVEKSCPIGF